MTSIILRRSSAMTASRRRIAAALYSTFESLQSSGGDGVLHGVDGKALSSFRKPENRFFFDVIRRSFHGKSRPLDFKASLMSQAEFAVDYDEGRSSDEGLDIVKLGIAKEIVSALANRGITKLFPIQKAVLEPAMQGRDMIGRARTGTGKTLAFGIPIMDKIIQFNAKNGRGRNPLALVLAPTRELARQVEKEFQDSAPSLDTICVYGGTPISRQMRQLDMGVDIAVGTPGRIIDLLNRGSLNLSEVNFVVLDEADQMLQVGFQEDVEKILERLPQKRHTMMFSATMPSWIKKLTQNYLSNPLTIDLVGDSDQKLPDGISLYSIVSDMYGKAAIIGPLISEHAKGGKCIVFTQTKRDADRLSYAMGRNLKCEPLHGDITQSQRERTLAGFRDGYFNVLVATDVAARGLDIPNVDLVIHYELPNNSEIFVHRSGRTGRACKKGNAILIYSQDQTRAVRMIEREVGCRFTELPRMTVDRASAEMFSDMSSSSRFGSSGSFRDRRSDDSGFGRFGSQGGSSFGRFGSQGGSSFGRSGSYGNSGNDRSGGSRRDSFGQMGGRYGERNSGSFGSFGGSAQSGSGFGGSNRNGAGEFGGSGGFGDFRSSNRSSGFGNFGSGRPSNFGNSSSGSGLFGNSRSGNFGNSFAGNKQDEN